MKIRNFLEQLEMIASKLDHLDNYDAELDQEMENLFGSNKRHYSGMMGLIHQSTHEVSGDIDGYYETIDLAVRYYTFKKLFAEYDESVIERVLSPACVDMETKKQLLRLGCDKRKLLDEITRMKSEWARLVGKNYADTTRHVNGMLGEESDPEG